MLSEFYKNFVQQTAKVELEKGGKAYVIPHIPTIAIRLHDGPEFWMDEDEAQTLLDQVPKGVDPNRF